MLALSAWAYGRMPDTPIPVHWCFDGQANGYAGKFRALPLCPSWPPACRSFFRARRRSCGAGALRAFHLAYGVGWVGVMLVLFVSHLALIATGLGGAFDVAKPRTFSLALLL